MRATLDREQLQAIMLSVLIVLSPIAAITAFSGTVQAAHNQNEPNDTPAEADENSVITGGGSVTTEIGEASGLSGNVNDDSDTDVDYMAFDVDSGDDFTARLIHHGPGYDDYEGDLAFDVINDDETTVATVDDTDPGAGLDDASNYNESITIDPSSEGYSGGTERWYLKVYAPDNPVDEDCPDGGNSQCDGQFEIQFSFEPTADISEDDDDDTLVEGTDTITFDASGSSDPDGDIEEYRWDFDGDGNTDETTSSATTDHTYSISDSTHAGGSTDFTPEVTVADSAGGTDTATLGNSLTIRNDFDGDGTADINDDDGDGDGIDDTYDPDNYNTDTDGDGISDDVEATNSAISLSDINNGEAELVDTDGDGTPDIEDTDSDGDGTSDSTEGTSDADGDGYDDYRDTAPTFTGGASLSNVDEDASDPGGTTANSLISGNFDDSSDGDSDSFKGLLITADGATSSEGTWQYSTDGSSWTDVGSVSTSSALFVDSSDYIRFSPAGDYDGTAGALTVRAVDDSETFSTGDSKDVSNFDSLSGVSGASGVNVDITVDDAPEVSSIARADSSPTSASTVDFDVTFAESVSGISTDDFSVTQTSDSASGSVSSVGSSSGTTITVTVGSVTGDGDIRLDLTDDDSITSDSSSTALGGDGTSGDADGSYTSGETYVVDNSPPTLTDDTGSTDEDTSAEIIADLTTNDNDDSTLTVTKVDGQSGNVGSTTAGGTGGLFTIASDGAVDFDPNSEYEDLGGSESETSEVQVTVEDGAGNSDTQTVTATINGVNDAPTMSSDDRTLSNINEDATTNDGDTASTILSSAGSASDVEGDTLGVAVTNVDDTDGTWEYSTDGGSSWSTIDSASPATSSALLLADTDRIRFVPNTEFNGNVGGSVSISAWDQTTGSSGDTSVDTTSNGGTTAFASTTATASLTVDSVNDAPSFSLPSSPSQTAENDVSSQTVTDFVDTATFDAGGGSDESSQSLSDFLVSNDNNNLFTSQPDIDNSGDLTYTPADDVQGTATVDVQVVDDGGTSNGGTDTSATQTVDITIDNQEPSIASYEVSNPSDRDVTVSFDSDEQLSSISASVSGQESATLSTGDFTETTSGSTYGYSATYSGSLDGTYEITLDTAEDDATYDGATGQSGSTRVSSSSGGGGGGGDDSDDAADNTNESAEGDSNYPTVSDDASAVTGTQNDDGTTSFAVDMSADSGQDTVVLDLSGSNSDGDGGTSDDDEGRSDDDEGRSDEDGDQSSATAEQGDNVAVDTIGIRPTEDATPEFDITVEEWDVSSESTTDGDPYIQQNSLSGAGATNTTDTPETRLGDTVDVASTSRQQTSNETEPQQFLNATGATAVGYVEVNHTNPDTDIENVTFQFRVRKGYLNESSVGPDSVALYRDEADGWNELDAEKVGENETFHFFEATSPGLSLFTIGSAQPAIETQQAQVTNTTITRGESATVTATVQNRGRVSGNHTVALTADGEQLTNKTVTVAGDATKTVTLTYTPDATGEYDIAIDDRDAGLLTVQPANETTESDDSAGGLLLTGVLVVAGVVGLLLVYVRRQDNAEDAGANDYL